MLRLEKVYMFIACRKLVNLKIVSFAHLEIMKSDVCDVSSNVAKGYGVRHLTRRLQILYIETFIESFS